ncbi:hypothetical protein BDR22DRAFT_902231, partial [Usnea florida]
LLSTCIEPFNRHCAQSHILANTNPPPSHRRPHTDTSAITMLNAAAMKNLLSANVDENASHFAFFSHTGTLMGHDHGAPVKAIKRFAAFAANTWAHNDIAVRESGRTVKPLTPGTAILRATVREDGKGLECLVLRVQEWVGAVTHVREGTLLAALKGKGDVEGEGEGDGVGGRVSGVGGGEGGDGVESEGEGEGEGGEGEDGAKGKGKEKEGEGEGEGEEAEEPKPSKIQILVWRSEGMGQYMADQLGPKFKIPKGFY